MSSTPAWDGDDYQKRFDDLAASGTDVHGEASFVMRYAPRTVLDAGCGTGRVAIELARRGVEVVGVEVEEAMLTTACERAPEIEWITHDLRTLDLGRTFDIVVLVGNVPLFTPAGTQPELIAGCARHVAPGGVMICGYQLGRGYELDAFDADCSGAGLALDERFATWSGDPYVPGGDYAVSVTRPTTPH